MCMCMIEIRYCKLGLESPCFETGGMLVGCPPGNQHGIGYLQIYWLWAKVERLQDQKTTDKEVSKHKVSSPFLV